MKEYEKEIDLDLEIEVIEGREEMLVASAGTCSSCLRGPQIQIIAAPE